MTPVASPPLCVKEQDLPLLQSVEIPESAKSTVAVVDAPAQQSPLGSISSKLYEIPSRSHDTGITDLAARHNEHRLQAIRIPLPASGIIKSATHDLDTKTMETIQGIYENGVVRPLEPLALPESTPVSIVVPTAPAQGESQSIESSVGMDAIYDILSRRHNSGIRDLAERHNEHQP